MNKRISASSSREGLVDRADTAFQHVMETYRGREWPPVADFVKAMDATAPRTSASKAEPDPAARIRAGEPIADSFVFGRNAVELIVAGKITEDDLRPYRSALFFSAKDVQGEDIARGNERKMQARHDDARQAAGLPPIFAEAVA